MSRPTGLDSQRRKALFLCLIADGVDGETAARQAGLSPWRALRIVTESDYRDVVQAIRGGAGPIAVEVGEQDGRLAA